MVSITEIEVPKCPKPYLGGYRNTKTNIEYLNAASQTAPRFVKRGNAETREVQHVEKAEVGTQPVRQNATQTWRKDFYIQNCTDVYKSAKTYESNEQMVKRRGLDGQARVIQKAYRAYRLMKYIKECSKEYRKRLEDCKKLEIERIETLRQRHQTDIIRQTFPRARGDFDKLYNLIDRWRTSRLEMAKNRFFSGARKAESCRILEKMTEMLKSLEEHRRFVYLEKQEKKRIRFLAKHCKPIKWHGYKAKKVEMITLRIQKAREYKNINENLTRNDKSVEERIEFLILLKNALIDHSCEPVQHFLHLIDQEIALISSGVHNKWLNNLRQRISIAFLKFVAESGDCTCTTEAEDRSNSEFSESGTTKKLVCKSCLKIMPFTSFSAHVRMRKVSCCLSCTWLRQQNIDKLDYDPYTFMLNGIRADEQRRNCYSSLLYVMQEPGVYHLVNNIWHGHSIVSETEDIYNLRLVRFNIAEEWSPWNCILLTTEEAETHYFVKNFETFYSKRLLHRIHLAHQIAKSHFKELIKFEKNFRVSSRYYMIQDREDYVPSESLA
ncbi:IQ and ubiquitin-like domain-containing protein [Venturia canescens]|uniref:IQ and ubiquitin-like domain-containing protein n=1 Tax=Venturia canescens TaxID=32260 RepID=UPI001C9C1414|nr:IQ and ubiquitin-like domain-containing protein [Venturia canescens]